MRWRIHLGLLRLYRLLPRPGRRWVIHRLAPSYTVGAVAVVERDGRVLLIRQSYRPRWGLPGGLLRRGEAPEDAVRREVMEELGVRVEPTAEPCVVVDPAGRRVDVVFRARLADDATPAPRSAEIVAAAWFGRDELPELQEEAEEALRAVRQAGH